MKKLAYTFETEIAFSAPVWEHAFVLRCQPHVRPDVRVLESRLEVEPGMRYRCQTDAFGNRLAVGREPEPHSFMRYCSSGVVEVDFARGRASGAAAAPDGRERAGRRALAAGLAHAGAVPDGRETAGACAPAGAAAAVTPASWDAAHAVYRHPGPLTLPDDSLRSFAREAGARVAAMAAEGAGPEALAGAIAQLSHAVFERMDYVPGSTGVRTTAAEAFRAHRGVCQDFSHVLVCALRECGVAARYVSGLALGEGQTHAWAEAWVDGHGWTGFDPTRDQLVDETYLPLAVGRDWTDCPIETGSFFGAATQSQTVHMTVAETA